MNPTVIVHDCKFKVDGITKFLDSNFFEFDHTFHEDDSTDDVYLNCVENLLPFVLKGGRATVFAYGQTGTGKTFTISGVPKDNDLKGIMPRTFETIFKSIECDTKK